MKSTDPLKRASEVRERNARMTAPPYACGHKAAFRKRQRVPYCSLCQTELAQRFVRRIGVGA